MGRTRRWSPWRRPASARGARRSTCRWSRAPITARRRRAPRQCSGPGSPGSSPASLDPNPEAGGGLELAPRRTASRSSTRTAFEARAQNEAWRAWVATGRPFVTLKLAVTLDGRVTVPGGRWVTGEESRRLVHELRAAADAVAVGMGTVRADDPQLTARDVARRAPAEASRLRPGPARRTAPSWSCSPGRSRRSSSGSARKACSRCSSRAGRGSPTSFLEDDLVDKLLLFVAPTIAGEGPLLLANARPADPVDPPRDPSRRRGRAPQRLRP